MLVVSVVLKNTKTNELKEMPINGIFISVGYIPHTELAVKLGINLDESGHILIDKEQKKLSQQEIIDKYYTSNMIDKRGNIIVSPLLRTIAEIPYRLYLMQTYKQLEYKTYNH